MWFFSALSGVGKSHPSHQLWVTRPSAKASRSRFIAAADMMLQLVIAAKTGASGSVLKGTSLAPRLLIIGNENWLMTAIGREEANPVSFNVPSPKRYGARQRHRHLANLPFSTVGQRLDNDTNVNRCAVDRLLPPCCDIVQIPGRKL